MRLTFIRSTALFFGIAGLVPFGRTAPDKTALNGELEAHYRCAARCNQMSDRDRKQVSGLYHQAGCSSEPGESWSSPVCASSPEQLCVGSCGGGQADMSKFVPDAFGKDGTQVSDANLAEFREAYVAHKKCAARCSRDGVVVSARGEEKDVAAEAAAVLRRCGVVQLADASDTSLLDRADKAIAKLRSAGKKYDALLDQEQLHDGRYQVYLPFVSPFSSRKLIGANDLVLAVLADYFGSSGFGIDHVSVLTAGSPSGNQSLHPDVAYFKALAVSVHTALQDISRDMGPTFFCPCTGEALERDEWPASAAIKMTILKRKKCLGMALVPEFTKRGTITIYDGAMFHKGLANPSGRDRHILKLEVGAADFPARRNYPGTAPRAAQKQTLRFREAFGPPRMAGKNGESKSEL